MGSDIHLSSYKGLATATELLLAPGATDILCLSKRAGRLSGDPLALKVVYILSYTHANPYFCQ